MRSTVVVGSGGGISSSPSSTPQFTGHATLNLEWGEIVARATGESLDWNLHEKQIEGLRRTKNDLERETNQSMFGISTIKLGAFFCIYMLFQSEIRNSS